MTDEHIERPTERDLERHKQNALTRRQLAWELLKQTRNPRYVALRYGYPVETMEKALEQIPDTGPSLYDQLRGRERRSHSARNENSTVKRASEVLPEVTRSREPGEDDDLE